MVCFWRCMVKGAGPLGCSHVTCMPLMSNLCLINHLKTSLLTSEWYAWLSFKLIWSTITTAHWSGTADWGSVRFNPHFRYFSSPFRADEVLGVEPVWPSVTAIHTLAGLVRPQRTFAASAAGGSTWCPCVGASPGSPWRVAPPRQERVASRLGSFVCCFECKDKVVNKTACWCNAQWDVHPAGHEPQLCLLNTPPISGACGWLAPRCLMYRPCFALGKRVA
jgi:hypothetical protein